MKGLLNWQIVLGLGLIALSTLLYLLHYALFRDSHHIFIFMIGEIAFVPVEVLLVTLIIDRLLSAREKRIMLEKMNMAIGIFFSEVGTSLLKVFAQLDPNSDIIRKELFVTTEWSDQAFQNVKKRMRGYAYHIDIKKDVLEHLKGLLAGKRNFLLRLLENPNLLEHESFTDILWAVFHILEELVHRADVQTLPDTDYEHLKGDIQRVYVLLVSEWLSYMRHLKGHYPYLFSLAMRTNPFNPSASATIYEKPA